MASAAGLVIVAGGITAANEVLFAPVASGKAPAFQWRIVPATVLLAMAFGGLEKAGAGAAGSSIQTWRMEEMSLGQAIWIGACQILSAVFPGTSRSMATIAGGQLAGMSRASALEFSFFLSIPTMVVATGYTLLKSLRGKGENPIGVSQLTSQQWAVLGIGFVVSFVVAYASVAWFMAWVRKRGFAPFAVYRIVVGIAVLAFAARLAG